MRPPEQISTEMNRLGVHIAGLLCIQYPRLCFKIAVSVIKAFVKKIIRDFFLHFY